MFRYKIGIIINKYYVLKMIVKMKFIILMNEHFHKFHNNYLRKMKIYIKNK